MMILSLKVLLRVSAITRRKGHPQVDGVEQHRTEVATSCPRSQLTGACNWNLELVCNEFYPPYRLIYLFNPMNCVWAA